MRLSLIAGLLLAVAAMTAETVTYVADEAEVKTMTDVPRYSEEEEFWLGAFFNCSQKESFLYDQFKYYMDNKIDFCSEEKPRKWSACFFQLLKAMDENYNYNEKVFTDICKTKDDEEKVTSCRDVFQNVAPDHKPCTLFDCLKYLKIKTIYDQN